MLVSGVYFHFSSIYILQDRHYVIAVHGPEQRSVLRVFASTPSGTKKHGWTCGKRALYARPFPVELLLPCTFWSFLKDIHTGPPASCNRIIIMSSSPHNPHPQLYHFRLLNLGVEVQDFLDSKVASWWWDQRGYHRVPWRLTGLQPFPLGTIWWFHVFA